MLSKDQILSARNARMKKINVPELGGDIILRVLSIREREQFTVLAEGLSGTDSMLAYAAFVIGDAKGERMFDDWRELEALPQDAVLAICDEGHDVNTLKKTKSKKQPEE